MQSQCVPRFAVFSNLQAFVTQQSLRIFCALLAAIVPAGCGQTVSTLDPVSLPEFHQQNLQVRVSSEVDERLIKQFATEWSKEHDAAIEVTRGPIAASDADVVIVSPSEMPALAESGRFLPIPTSLQGREHFYHWDGLLPMYQGLLPSWNGVNYGLPLLGEGHVLIYRQDRLAEAELKVPATWEDFVRAAELLSKPNGQSLSPLPRSSIDLETMFHLIAACYDRQAIQQSESGVGIPDEATADRLYSYHYRLQSGSPRINSAAFVYALQLLREMQQFRQPAEDADPMTTIRDGRATLAIANLKDVASLQSPASPVRGKLGIAPLPGSSFVFVSDPKKPDEARRQPTRTVNRVPYLGASSWLGMVGKNCKNPGAAWAFLATLAHPEQMGSEAIMAAKWGAGPFRAMHTEERTRGLWFGYDLPPAQTDALLDALKQNLAPSLINHCFRLRLPNELAHREAFDRIVRPAIMDQKTDPKAVMNEVAAAWEKLWEGIPASKRREWIQYSYGLSSSR